MKSKIIEKLRKKEYRDAFVSSQISIGIPFQIKALREKRGWSQKQLAELTDMKQPRISAMESPGGGSLNLETLKRLASAFDVGLIVRFAPFSELVNWSESFSPDTFYVSRFSDEKFDEVVTRSTDRGRATVFVISSKEHFATRVDAGTEVIVGLSETLATGLTFQAMARTATP